MDVEKAFVAIKNWYGDESYSILGNILTETQRANSNCDFDQLEDFISVTGYQNSVGMDGDSFEGQIYFEFEKGKFIATQFYC